MPVSSLSLFWIVGRLVDSEMIAGLFHNVFVIFYIIAGNEGYSEGHILSCEVASGRVFFFTVCRPYISQEGI